MLSVYLLLDTSIILRSQDLDSCQVIDSCIMGVFEDRFHAINEQEKLRDSLNRPIYIIKKNVTDPAVICKKKPLHELLEDR